MQPQIVNKPAFTIVGLRLETQPMSAEIPQLWQTFGPRMDEVPNVVEPHVSYGLMEMDEAQNRLIYMAGLAASDATNVPAGMTSWQVPATTYAVFETTLPAIGDTFVYIFDTWLPTAGYRQVAGPHFERYGERFDPGDPASTLEIYVPVEKKG